MINAELLKNKFIEELKNKVTTKDISECKIFVDYAYTDATIDLLFVNSITVGFIFKGENEDYGGYKAITEAYDGANRKNYIVCMSKQKVLVKLDIPKYWGIVSYDGEKFELIKRAEDNPYFDGCRQVFLLDEDQRNILYYDYSISENLSDSDKVWELNDKDLGTRIEKSVLKSLLDEEKESSDMYKKMFILKCEKNITESEEPKAEEKKAEKQPLEFINPNGSDSYLNWLDLYYDKRREYLNEKKKLKRLMGGEITVGTGFENIEVSLGAPWINKEIVYDFIVYLLELKGRSRRKVDVIKEDISGNWQVYYHNYEFYNNVLANVKYGVYDYNALDIIDALLNLREIKINNYYGELDEKSTIAVLDKQKIIEEKFKEWIWSDEDRKQTIVKNYNDMFGGFVPKLYNGSDLLLKGKNPEVHLYGYQKDAIKKIVENKNSLLAFDVGTGKTYIMIAAAMEMISLGKTKKPLFVVPNNIVGQWQSMFEKLYPQANIFIVEPKCFKPDMRNEVLRTIKNEVFDGIIMAYSCFEQINVSKDFVEDVYSEISSKYQGAIDDVQYESGLNWDKANWKISQIEREISKEQTKMAKLIDRVEFSTDLPFDELGITALFVDEAHNFKNLPVDSKMKNIRGISVAGSMKCTELLYKVRCVQQSGGQVIFSTGTPLSNSIADAFVMQKYLQNEDLERIHLDKFDNWVKTFAKPEQVCEIDVDTSGFRFVRRFSTFHNLPELSKMFSVVSDFYASSVSKDLPKFNDYTDIIIGKSKALDTYMKNLCKRTELIRTGKVSRKEDNMLKISTDGRKAALDLTLVGKKQKYDEFSKVYQCVSNVAKIYNDFDGCSQIIFCDYSTPKGDDFSVYKELKDRLVKKGIPEKEIQFVHTCTTESSRMKLYENVNKGIVRILIGSTFKLGIGANVQTKLKAIHHIDVPWRPADMVQREGRILRKGNENEEIYIYRYIIEGSFDAYSWQILETKQTFISQFLTGSAYQRSASDLEDNVLSYAEVKALALANPKLKVLTEKQNKLRNIKVLHMQEIESKSQLRDRIEELKEELEKKQNDLNRTTENSEYIKSLDLEDYKETIKEFSLNINMDNLTKVDSIIGKLLDFDVIAPSFITDKKVLYKMRRNDVTYFLQYYEENSSTIKSLWLFFKKFDDKVLKAQENVESVKNNIASATKELEAPFVYKDSFDEMQRECDALINEIKNEGGETNGEN